MADGFPNTAELPLNGTQSPLICFVGGAERSDQIHDDAKLASFRASIGLAAQYQPERYVNLDNPSIFASLGPPPSYYEYTRQKEGVISNLPLAPSLASSDSSYQRFKHLAGPSGTLDHYELSGSPFAARCASECSDLSRRSGLSQHFSTMSLSSTTR
jgi:hypothetical protein